MHDTPPVAMGRTSRPMRALDNLEVSLNGLAASLERAIPIIEGMQRHHAQLTAVVFSRLGECEPEEAIGAVPALKAAIERSRS